MKQKKNTKVKNVAFGFDGKRHEIKIRKKYLKIFKTFFFNKLINLNQ
jgi:hypothetical protein